MSTFEGIQWQRIRQIAAAIEHNDRNIAFDMNSFGNKQEKLEGSAAPREPIADTSCGTTGCIGGFQPTMDYDIQFVGGIKTALVGGDGLFFATLRGPGKIWLHSLPLSRLAGRIVAAGRGGREEGSVIGGLGRMLDGDNS